MSTFCEIAVANTAIQTILPYQPGKPIDELKRELGLAHIVKLASNENPLGASSKVTDAVQIALADIGRYPDGNGFELKSAIAKHYAVDPLQITLGNGSNDILELVARTFVSVDDEVIYSQHAFAVYPLATLAVGGKGIQIPARDYGHDLTAMAQAITPRTKVIFIANPNNPTGTCFYQHAFIQFMAQVPRNVLVVLDEAYVEYFPEIMDSVPLLDIYPNLLISRTFSKAYGLASMRVGFGLASTTITDLLNRIRQPFNVNSFAQVAAIAALGDTEFVARSRKANLAGMAQLLAGIQQLGLSYIPSKANFICINVGANGVEVFNKLLTKGVIVRPVANYGLTNWIRVSIGLTAENDAFLTALTEVLNS